MKFMKMNKEKLLNDYESLKNEYSVCRQKLDSKCEALLILTKNLDCCRQEKDQFKLMAEQVQQRYQALKRQLAGVGPRASSLELSDYSGMKSQNLAQLLCEMRECNKSLQFDADDLRQKLKDANGDIKLLREQIARQRVGTTDEGMNTRHFPAHEREDLVRQLEDSRQQIAQLERDLQQVFDEKEDQETERDVYKGKYERLNEELNYVLKGDEKRIVDIDALVMENKYLQERLDQMTEEKSIAIATVSKYKNLLERKKNKGILKLGQSRAGGVVISQRQVKDMLQNKGTASPTAQMMSDLQSLASALLETLNDKNLALQHQRKTNKILGNRVSELEKKLKTLEVSGLWSVSGKQPNLDKLRLECEDIKTLIPRKLSEDSDNHQDDEDLDSSGILSPMNGTPESSPSETTPTHIPKAPLGAGELSLEDLDFLPTKDISRLADHADVMSPTLSDLHLTNSSDTVDSTNVISPTRHDLDDPDKNIGRAIVTSTSDCDSTLEQSIEDCLETGNLESEASLLEDFLEGQDDLQKMTNGHQGDCELGMGYDQTATELNTLMEEMTLKVTNQKPGGLDSSSLPCEYDNGEDSVTVYGCDSGNVPSGSQSQVSDRSPLLQEKDSHSSAGVSIAPEVEQTA